MPVRCWSEAISRRVVGTLPTWILRSSGIHYIGNILGRPWRNVSFHLERLKRKSIERPMSCTDRSHSTELIAPATLAMAPPVSQLQNTLAAEH